MLKAINYFFKYRNGIELWGSTKPANMKRIQGFQLKVLHTVLNAPWYVSNGNTHNDLKIPTVSEVIKFHSSLSSSPFLLWIILHHVDFAISGPGTFF